MKQYDVIVIGAGNGGLSCATTIAQAGKKVAVFEKHNIPGGCGTTFRRGRFEFEVALHQLNSMGPKENPGEVRRLLREYGVEDKIDWIKIDSLYKINLPGGKGVALPADKDQACALLCREFPQDQEAIKRYYDTVWKFCAEADAFAAKQAQSNGEEPGAVKKALMKLLFPKLYPTLAKYGIRSCDDVLNEFFPNNVELQLCLSCYWCFMGMPPSRFPFTILAKCTYMYTIDNPYYLKGGSQMISQAMTEQIKKAGSDVFFNNGIKRIVIENGAAVGVIDQFGEEYRAKKIVSGVSPIITYGKMMDEADVPKAAREYFKGYTVGISALTCFIGLDCKPEEVGFTDSFNLTYDSLDANRDYLNSYELNTKIDPIVTTCYSVDDPSVSPEGTSIVTAGTLKYGAAWEKLSPDEYYKAKYDAANTIIDRLETRYPGFRSHIEEIEIATPLTHMRYLGHPGGAIYGYEQDLKSSVFFYPRDTFIPNLDFASGWVNTCGFGPNYVYGNQVGKRILKELN